MADHAGAARVLTRQVRARCPAGVTDLQRAAGRYAPGLARASALEDAGNSWAGRGDQDRATTLLSQAYALYEELGDADDLARVRSSLRAAGIRLRHWSHADRPAFGWDSLTDTERRVTDLVAQGLSNRQVANRVFLSTHTVAFHLRHIFWKLGITSRSTWRGSPRSRAPRMPRSGQPGR
jgi:DNA-binding CsgD family transcriptional regulator